MAAVALPIALGASIAGTAVTAIGAIRQGQAAENASNYNAALGRMNASIAESQAVAADQTMQRDQARKIGSMVASYGASGVSVAGGSPADVLADTVHSMALDRETLKYNYELRKLGYLSQAALDTANAENSRTASYLNATGAVLSGTSRAASFFMR